MGLSHEESSAAVLSHDAIRARLPAYAAGTLEGADLEHVRGHLATGCQPCLADVFARPTGLPRGGRPAPRGSPPRTAWRWRSAALLGLIAAAAVGGVATLRLHRLGVEAARQRQATQQLASELSGLQAERDGLAARVKSLEREELPEQRAALEAARVAQGELEQKLQEAQVQITRLARGVERRDRALEQAAGEQGVRGPLDDLLATPGVRVVPMAAKSAGAGRGYVLWSPERAFMLLYGFALSPPPAGASYRARVWLDDDMTVSVAALSLNARGALSAAIMLPEGDAQDVSAVELVLDPSGDAVLRADLTS